MPNPELDRRLAQLRWRKACAEAKQLLTAETGLQTDQVVLLEFDECIDSWEKYVTNLRARNDLVLKWAGDRQAEVRDWLDALAQWTAIQDVLCFIYEGEGVPPVAKVPLRPMLAIAIPVFLERRRDLMLATSDLSDGFSLEVNSVGREDEFDYVGWGEFAESS